MKKKLVLTIGALIMIFAVATSNTYAVFQADGDEVQTQISTNSLDIDLLESGKPVDGEKPQVLENLLPNQLIKKEMAVSNTRETTLYTRVTIRKYWINADGTKDFDADAKEIRLNYNKDAWLEEYVDDKNGEEIVLYYKQPLPANEVSENFLESIQVPDIGNIDAERKFALDVKVDAVQSLDAVNAMMTQWGVLATLENDEIVKIER